MLSLNDERWRQLKGARRTYFDPRPLLAELEAGEDKKAIWRSLWDELYHQGDVDDASYASVPHLVRIHLHQTATDWNTYALVATIELARVNRRNPEVPDWLRDDYYVAIENLAEAGMKELASVQDQYHLRGILCIIALQKRARTYARFLLEYSEEELLEIESGAARDPLSRRDF
jgi:hypothetical protein